MTIVLDTRKGGAQDISAQVDLAGAFAVSGVQAIQGPNALAPLFATTFEHSPSGRAWVLGWAHLGAGIEQDLQLDKAGMDFGGTFCGQYKTWFGRTAGGGGYGSIGAYDQALGHKSSVIFRRPFAGGGSTNNNRITTYHNYNYQGGMHGQAFSVENYVQADGSTGPEYTLCQDNTADPTLGITGGMTGGIPPVLDLASLIGTVVGVTFEIRLESAQGAGDGQLREWINATPVFTVLNAKTGAAPYTWKEWQIGGPTWTNGGPAFDCTQYIWDIAIWGT